MSHFLSFVMSEGEGPWNADLPFTSSFQISKETVWPFFANDAGPGCYDDGNDEFQGENEAFGSTPRFSGPAGGLVGLVICRI